MRLLLDTHALIWLVYNPSRLSEKVRETVADSDVPVFVSSVSAFEVSLKYRIGKLDFAASLATRFIEVTEMMGFDSLSLSAEHGQRAGVMPNPHKDPFDRMLIAQALVADLVLVSKETLFDGFGVSRLW